MRRELGALGDHRHVDAGDLRFHLHDDTPGLADENRGVGVLPARIAGWEILSDVARTGGAQQCVGDGVQNRVAVGVAGQAAGVADAHAAQDERARIVEGVDVDALPDPNHVHCSSIRSAAARSSGRVILKLMASPGTTRTS